MNKETVLSLQFEEKVKHIEKGEYLDTFILDKDWRVRKEVAKQGFGLDKLVYDDDKFVRKEVARQGYELGILVDDVEWQVRREVAKQGVYLDVLVKDDVALVREEVAKQGFGLDVLRNDEIEIVRIAVVEQLKKTDMDKVIESIRKGDCYDFISNNGYRLSKAELVSIIKEYDYMIHSMDICDDANSMYNKIADELEESYSDD